MERPTSKNKNFHYGPFPIVNTLLFYSLMIITVINGIFLYNTTKLWPRFLNDLILLTNQLWYNYVLIILIGILGLITFFVSWWSETRNFAVGNHMAYLIPFLIYLTIVLLIRFNFLKGLLIIAIIYTIVFIIGFFTLYLIDRPYWRKFIKSLTDEMKT